MAVKLEAAYSMGGAYANVPMGEGCTGAWREPGASASRMEDKQEAERERSLR